MRLYTMYVICRKNISIIDEAICSQEGATALFRVGDWDIIKKSLYELYQIKALQGLIDNIFELVPITR